MEPHVHRGKEGETLSALSPEEYERRKAEYEKEKEARMHKTKAHPARRCGYKVECRPNKEARRHFEDRQDWLFLEWIRQALNVSCLFRYELASVFWTKIQIDTWEEDSMWEIPTFLADRPVVWTSIKSLSMRLDPHVYMPEDLKRFNSWCVYISRSLILDHIEFHMAFEEDDLKKISSGDKSYDYLATFRKLNVIRSFKIYLLVTSLENWHQITDREVEKRKKELKLKYEPLVREFMLSDSLRSPPTNAGGSATSRPRFARLCDGQPQLPQRVSVRCPPTLSGILQHISNLQSRTAN
jgi:hypothetical protein